MEDRGEIEEPRRRLEALEARMDEVADQQAATRRLAVNSDRDVAALQEQRRADVQLMQALRQTQLEHGRTLAEHSKVLGALVSGQVALMQQVGAIMGHLGIEAPARPEE